MLFERLIGGEAIQRYFDADVLRSAMRNMGRRGRPTMYLWPVVNFALWHRHRIEHESIDALTEESGRVAA